MRETGGGKRQLEQVSSASTVPPSEPADPTEADVDFSKEEADLDRQLKELKAKKAKLVSRKKQAVGGKKLERMRKYAKAAAEWASKATTKYIASVKRANDAVASLQEYEDKLGIPEEKRVGLKLVEVHSLDQATEAAELLEQI